jgi:hypothetical protein
MKNNNRYVYSQTQKYCIIQLVGNTFRSPDHQQAINAYNLKQVTYSGN